MRSASFARVVIGVTAVGLIALIVVGLFSPPRPEQRRHKILKIKSEMLQLVDAVEKCRTTFGQYPPATADDPETVKQFLVKAFPNYKGGLPEKCQNLDAASSLVFWLGGMTGKDGKPIGFSADPKNPFDTTNERRIGLLFVFDPARLRNDGGLQVYVPPGNSSQSDPYVYFRPDSKGEYHGAWKNCRPCRDSSGGWINPKSYQLFSPGTDGKYGTGVQYPSGMDYDAQRLDDMGNFTNGATLGDDMP